ncbi:MAG: hypothetical protein QM650_07605 [Microlunatus sp.]
MKRQRRDPVSASGQSEAPCWPESSPELDTAIVGELRRAERTSHGWGRRFCLKTLSVENHQVDVLIQSDNESARIWIALPSSYRPSPWMMFGRPDAVGWVQDLIDWISEEVDTSRLGSKFVTEVDSAGVSRLVVDGYGLRTADEEEHARLRAQIGPHGFSKKGRRSTYRQEYALECALDHLEFEIANRIDPRSHMITSEGVMVDLSASLISKTEVLLLASTGIRARITACRRVSLPME